MMNEDDAQTQNLKLDEWVINRVAKLKKLAKTSNLQKQLLIFFDKPELNELEQKAFEKIVRAERSLERGRKAAKIAENALHRNSSRDRAEKRKRENHGKVLMGVAVVLMIRTGVLSRDSFLTDAKPLLSESDFNAMSDFLDLELAKLPE